jgi:hypothetical protein
MVLSKKEISIPLVEVDRGEGEIVIFTLFLPSTVKGEGGII